MDCKEFSNLLDAYMDGALSEERAEGVEAHERQCARCAQLLILRRDCRRLEADVELPESFSSGWRQMIREEWNMKENTGKNKAWKNWIAAAAALVFVVGGTLLTRDMPALDAAPKPSVLYSRSANGTGGIMANGYEMDTASMKQAAAGESSSPQEAKIIRTASFSLKTEKFDEQLAQVQQLVADVAGRVEYLSTYGDLAAGDLRTASLTLRIPSARLDEFLAGAQGIGRVTSLQQQVQDVSDSYYDVQSRLETQQKKMERLTALMDLADDVSDLVEIEAAIADTQYWIDHYTAQLQSYDGRVDESTVRVTIDEVYTQESEEASFGQRIAAGIEASLKNGGKFLGDAAVFVVSAAPWLACAAVIGGIIALIFRRKRH